MKILMNFDYDSLNCFTLILSGEPRLTITLSKAINEALRQRITVHYEFHGLDPGEISSYVSHKLKLAGGAESIMAPDALSAIVGASNGNPRTIDNTMTTALTLGAQLKKNSIDADVIMAAVPTRLFAMISRCFYFLKGERMYICVPLPVEIEAKLSQLKRENFFLWNFLSQHDLWDEAHEFLTEEAKSHIPCSYADESDELPF